MEEPNHPSAESLAQAHPGLFRCALCGQPQPPEGMLMVLTVRRADGTDTCLGKVADMMAQRAHVREQARQGLSVQCVGPWPTCERCVDLMQRLQQDLLGLHAQ